MTQSGSVTTKTRSPNHLHVIYVAGVMSTFAALYVRITLTLHLFVYPIISVESSRNYSDDCSSTSDNAQWNFLFTTQSELDQFVETARLNRNDSKCIYLSLVGNISYTLDIVDFMNVTSSSIANSGSLIVQGIGGKVEIDCVSSRSDWNELLQILRPISNALLVVLDELVFINCPVPVLIEEVSTVVIKNCVFQ